MNQNPMPPINNLPMLGQYPQTAHNLVVHRSVVRQFIQQYWEIVGAMVPADWQNNSRYYRPANRPGLRDFDGWKVWMGGSGQWLNASVHKKNQLWSLLERMIIAVSMHTSGVDNVPNRTQVGDGAMTLQLIPDYHNLYLTFFGTPSNRTDSSVRCRGMVLALIGKEEKTSEIKEALETRLAEAEGELQTEQNEKEELQNEKQELENRMEANDARSEALEDEMQVLRNQLAEINEQLQAGAATATENTELRQQLNEEKEKKEEVQELAADLLVCHTQFLQRAAAQAKRTKGGQEVVEMAHKKLRARDNLIGSSSGQQLLEE